MNTVLMHALKPSSAARFEAAIQEFRTKAHNSLVCNAIIERLVGSTSDAQYATGTRNECVRRLAYDVETSLLVSANLVFRTSGYLHDALQDLMDVYVDMMDEVYCVDPEEQDCVACALCREE